MAKDKETKKLEADFRLAKKELFSAINSKKNYLSFMAKEYPNCDFSEKHDQDSIKHHDEKINEAINEYSKYPKEMQIEGVGELNLDEEYKSLVFSKIIL